MIYGLMAEFETPEELLKAAENTHQAGFTRYDAYTPFPIEGLDEAVGLAKNRVGLMALLGGVVGASTGFGMQWYACAIDYPLNVAGKPYFSWPAFIPVTFELTVLFAAISGALGMLALNHLPELYHPVFAVEEFRRASKDRFFICVQAVDPLFELSETKLFLQSLSSQPVREVPGEEL